MVFFGDMGFFLKYKHMLAQFPGIKVSCNPETAKHPWVKTMARDTKWAKGIASTPGKVSWNHNSGSAAITVAAQAGAKRIYLLGFDMGLNGHEQQHWHDIYHHMGGRNPKKPHLLPFDRHLSGFPFIAKDAKSWGIEIINVCPESRITQFPKVSLKEVINERN
jgi:hypothetical protein